ncbi:class I adenylate-forming enzyme family protein [Schinkia sp. CFF1]
MLMELDWLNNRARISSNHVAVVDGDSRERWTYAELNTRANRLAAYFLKVGVQKGERVALLSPNHISYFDLYFACGKIGAIFVPLNWRLAPSEIQYIIADCGPRIIAYHSDVDGLVEEIDAIPTLQVDSPSYEQIFLMDEETVLKTTILKEDPLTIIYTGGTTGKPKGVVLTHQSIFGNTINTIFSWNLNGDDTTLTILPMFHSGGLFALTMPLLHMGGTVVFCKKFDSAQTVSLLNRESCTIMLLVPTMYHMFIESSEFQQSSFPSMHTFLSGGAPCPQVIYKAFEKKGLIFKEGYGLTEAGPNNFYIDPGHLPEKRGSIGKPMLFNDVLLVNEDGVEAGIDEVGELLIKGCHVFDHYWNQPGETKAAKINGWLHTGDLGKKDKDGFFYIVGRMKEMIITGGENVYPLEVEHVLSEHEAVSEVAVIGISHEKWGEIVTAFVVRKTGQAATANELKTFCQQKLGGYKVPKEFIFIDALPKTHVGKIDKKQLLKLGR